MRKSYPFKKNNSFIFCLLWVLSLFTGLGFNLPSSDAHFNHFEPRIIHIAEQDGSLILFMRMPLPLLLLPADWKGVSEGQDIPFTLRVKEKDSWQYYLDGQSIKLSPKSFYSHISKAYQLTINDQLIVNSAPLKLAIFTTHKRKPFSSLDYANKALSGPELKIPSDKLDIFGASIDIKVVIEGAKLTDHIEIKSALGEKLKVINRLANIVQIHRPDAPSKHTTIGVLDVSFDKSATNFTVIFNQLKSGAWHIIIGLDHILFLMLIIIAASSAMVVVRNATAFTIGHSISLAIGVYGHLTFASWFIPFIELSIALSILYGAIVVLLKKAELFNFSTIVLIGLIHGFGFSFILSELANEGGAISLKTLLFFNLGIELGQILFYIFFSGLLVLFNKSPLSHRITSSKIVVSIAVVMSIYWIFDRGFVLLQNL